MNISTSCFSRSFIAFPMHFSLPLFKLYQNLAATLPPNRIGPYGNCTRFRPVSRLLPLKEGSYCPRGQFIGSERYLYFGSGGVECNFRLQERRILSMRYIYIIKTQLHAAIGIRKLAAEVHITKIWLGKSTHNGAGSNSLGGDSGVPGETRGVGLTNRVGYVFGCAGSETLRINWDEDRTSEQFRAPPLVA
jgi:hypothetical protein